MTITKERDGASLTIALEGRLDTATSPELESLLKDSLNGVSELKLDLAGVDYISSAGLRVLLVTQKTMNRQGMMRLSNVREPIMEIFEVTGFTQILTIG